MESTSRASECCLCGEVCPSHAALHRHHVEHHTVEEMSAALLRRPVLLGNHRGKNRRRSRKFSAGRSSKKEPVSERNAGKLPSNNRVSEHFSSEVGASQRKRFKYDGEKRGFIKDAQAHGKLVSCYGIDVKTGRKTSNSCGMGTEIFTENAENSIKISEIGKLEGHSDQIPLDCGTAAKMHASADGALFGHAASGRASHALLADDSSDIDITSCCTPRSSEEQCKCYRRLENSCNSSNNNNHHSSNKSNGNSKSEGRRSPDVPAQETTFLSRTEPTRDRSPELLEISERSWCSNLYICCPEARPRDVSHNDQVSFESRSTSVPGASHVLSSNGGQTSDVASLHWQNLSPENSRVEFSSEGFLKSGARKKLPGLCYSPNNSVKNVPCDSQGCREEVRECSETNLTVPDLFDDSIKNAEIPGIACDETRKFEIPLGSGHLSLPYKEGTNLNAEQHRSFYLASSDTQRSPEFSTLPPTTESTSNLSIHNGTQAYADKSRGPNSMNVISFWTQNLCEKSDDELTSNETLFPAPQKIMGQMMSDMTYFDDEWPELGDDITLIDDEELLSSLDLFPSLLDDFVIELSTLEGTGALTVQHSDRASAAALESGEAYFNGEKCLGIETSCKRSENTISDLCIDCVGDDDVGRRSHLAAKCEDVVNPREFSNLAKNQIMTNERVVGRKFEDDHSNTEGFSCCRSCERLGSEARIDELGFGRCSHRQHLGHSCHGQHVKLFGGKRLLLSDNENTNHISGKKFMVSNEHLVNRHESRGEDSVNPVCQSDVLSKSHRGMNAEHASSSGELGEIPQLLYKNFENRNAGNVDTYHVACDTSDDVFSRADEQVSCSDFQLGEVKEDQNCASLALTNSVTTALLEKRFGTKNHQERGCHDEVGSRGNECALNSSEALCVQEVGERLNEGDCFQRRKRVELSPSSDAIGTLGVPQATPLEERVDKELFSEENCEVGGSASDFNANDFDQCGACCVENGRRSNVNLALCNEPADHTKASEVIAKHLNGIKSSTGVPSFSKYDKVENESNTNCDLESQVPNITSVCTTRSSFFSGKSIYSLNHGCITTTAPSRHELPRLSSFTPPLSSVQSFKSDKSDSDINCSISEAPIDQHNTSAGSVPSSRRMENVQNIAIESFSSDSKLISGENIANQSTISNGRFRFRTGDLSVKTRLGRIVKISRKSDFFYGEPKHCNKSSNRQLLGEQCSTAESNSVAGETTGSVEPEVRKSLLIRSERRKIQLKKANLKVDSERQVENIASLRTSPRDAMTLHHQSSSNAGRYVEVACKSVVTPLANKPFTDLTTSKNSRSITRKIAKIKTNDTVRRKNSTGSSDGRTTCFECSYCGDEPSLETLRRMEGYDYGHHKVCLKCNKGLYRKKALASRKVNSSASHLKGTERCPVCDVGVSDVARHYKRVHEQVRVQCDICQEIVKKDCLKSHKNRKHGRISSIMCDHCGKIFKSAMSLQEHLYRVRHKIKSVLDSIFNE